MPRAELDAQAPAFTLNDFNGKSLSLSDYAGHKNVLVVFNRGYDRRPLSLTRPATAK